MSRLLWRDAQGVEGSVELASGEVMVGRALECAIRTEDAMVSRHHARVLLVNGQYVVEDMGSSNGIFYQEQRVMRHGLRHGDAIRCGSLWLRFVEGPMVGQRPQGPTEPAPIGHGGAALQLPPIGASAHGAVPVAVHGDQTPGPLGGIQGPTDPQEVPRLRRRVEQLKSELRIFRGGGESAGRLEQLDEELVRLSEERDRLKARVADLEATLRREGGDAMVQRAGAIAQTAAEIVSGLNDVLSNLRINVMAAEGEFDQYAGVIPRASFELIREALRSSAGDMETARELLRKLRALAM
ncbi:MAG TPA: FHA domain-containing protein [Kofleriaceae bacterium]|nr:FHA domain-containing protein [Kofleriaceae bacterium]